MKSFKLDAYGDLVFPMEWVYDLDAVVQLCLTRLYKIFDEDVFDLETGVDWFGIMLNQESTRDQKVLEIRSALLSIPQVTDVVRLDIQDPDEDGKMIIRFQINSEYGSTAEVNA